MPVKFPDLSNTLVLIPAFNEEKNLSHVITQLKRDLGMNPSQLILADDGSSDFTSLIARELGIRIIRSPSNQGKGYMLHQAFQVIVNHFPNFKWVTTLDGDGQHDHKDIPRLVRTLKNDKSLGIVIGKRDFTIMPHINRISNKLTSTWCVNWLHWDVPDIQCGFRAYRTSALHQILEYGPSTRKFEFETELLFITWLLDLKITSIPIRTVYFQNHRKSNVVPIIDTLRWVKLAFHFGFKPQFIRKMWKQKKLRKMRIS